MAEAMIPGNQEAYGALSLEIRQAIEAGSPEPPPRHEAMDREDAEMLFRCIMQVARHLAKKFEFTIKPWPEK